MTDENERAEVLVRGLDEGAVYGSNPAVRILADETTGQENVSAGTARFAPGRRGERHVRSVEEMVVVLEGEGRIVTDEGTYDLATGQAGIVRPGTHHYHENTGDDDLLMLWIFAPQGPEREIRSDG
jgi:quercetin dioxygenase-like cupin family protein